VFHNLSFFGYAQEGITMSAKPNIFLYG